MEATISPEDSMPETIDTLTFQNGTATDTRFARRQISTACSGVDEGKDEARMKAQRMILSV